MYKEVVRSKGCQAQLALARGPEAQNGDGPGSDTMSRMNLRPNSTSKASSKGEDCPSPYKQTTSSFPNQCGTFTHSNKVRTLNNKGGKLMPPYVAIFCHLEDTDIKDCGSHSIVVDRKFSDRYAQYGDVSPKVDVYAFGVVLYELISAKEAIVKTSEVITESKGLVALFEDVLHQSGAREGLRTVVDPKLGDDYSLDSVCKVAQLAKACTHENPQLRPSMRSIVVALMTLSSSSTEDWDIGSFYENQGLVHFMSGR
ncbi:Chitin elicitor receptor kinase 1 [Capsicum chinense]|nr:Chitin elicitor receptor kinase 1 [Capsicum chinense]